MPRPIVCVSLGLAGMLLAGCASASENTRPGGAVISAPEDTSPYHGVEVRQHRLPDITLRAASGGSFNLAKDTDKPVTLVFFGYTNCPDVCPTTVANVTQALRQAPASVTEKVQFVFITSDPARDSPKVLRDWLGRFDDSYVGVTGDLSAIEKVAKKLGVSMEGKDKLPSGGYLVGHGAQVIAFGSDERSRVLWTGGTPIGQYRDDIVRLVRKI